MKAITNIKGTILGRNELKKIKGGDDGSIPKCKTGPCTVNAAHGNLVGACEENSAHECVCKSTCFNESTVTDFCKI